MAGPEIHMKWNDFEENLRVSLKDFRNELNDVILHCSNGKTTANRLVLCACSDVFKTILMDSDVQQSPSVLLWETEITLLNHIINFMYCGEVKVTEQGLPSFLALAERLKVKGLCRKGEDDTSQNQPQPPQPSNAAFRSKQKRHKPGGGTVLEEISENEGRAAKRGRTNPHARLQSKMDDSVERITDSENVVLKSEQEEVLDLEPEQELVEGQEDLYPDPSALLESPSNNLLYPLEQSDPPTHLLDPSNHTMDSDGIQSTDQMLVPFQPLSNFGCDVQPDKSLDQSQIPDLNNTSGLGFVADPNNPFVCNLCMKSYKSQGSLQNHRSIYHRDQIRTRRT